MSDDYAADPDALSFDAKSRWTPWAGKLSAMRSVSSEAHVSPDIFGAVYGAWDVYNAFAEGMKAIDSYIASGAQEFEGIAAALLKTLREYTSADEDVHDEVRRVAMKWSLR